MTALKPGTRCECRDNTHRYDSTRPYARHNIGTCPAKAVRLVTVACPYCEDGDKCPTCEETRLRAEWMCAACADWHESAK